MECWEDVSILTEGFRRYKGRASFEMKRVMKKLGGAVRRRVNTNRPLTRIRSYAAVIASRRGGLKW